jgi:outer membrane biosynthesis protein TonB
MRRILATSLLLPSLFLPAVANASTPVDDASAPTPVRVSTGVTIPVLLDSSSLSLPQGYPSQLVPQDAEVGLSLIVDDKGQPQNIHVTKSYSPFWDARVIDTVNHFHFKPGTVSNQPTAVDLNLTVDITR